MFIRFAFASLLLVGSAMASTISYSANLNGANENPSNGSGGTGFAFVTVDTILQTMEVYVTFDGLSSGNTAAHIHCCTAAPGTAGVATTTPTFPGFPSGTTSGTYNQILDLTLASSYRAGFITAAGSVAAAQAQLLAGLAAGQTYFNIHTTNFAGGEIRGFLVETPEPSTWLLSSSALGLAALLRRKRSLK